MSDKKYYDAQLDRARQLQNEGQYGEAHALLLSLVAEKDGHLMGERTVLGLPRRLHAARLRLAKAEGDMVAKIGYQYTLVPPPQTLAKYAQFSPQERRTINLKSREDVPRLIHQIWIGEKALPVSVKAWAAHAAAHGYEYHLWRETDLEREGVFSNDVFRMMLDKGDYPGAVDVARYVLLERFGGIYLDCDWYPARDDVSFDAFLPLSGLTAFDEKTPRDTGQGSMLLANSFIAAPAGHPVFRRMLEAFPGILEEMPRAPAWWSTGPLIFTVVARAGSISLAPAGFVAAALADRAAFQEVEAIRRGLDETGGMLIAWKSW
ncbi:MULTISPECIES: glycosyltransferase family 32 protein [unclassified Rhizobium]|uniref:glycosyltransferase family 32 protein n=1 Tax=unclassified Rhizobium TaxID=2613769 RepID=UPI00247AE333|nr:MULTISPECIES: glycosyltransferase [unclassified Rhizobium]MDH7802902.1 mannosyltransferase OCH1-like enzyme [Rhizobium sp. AN70]